MVEQWGKLFLLAFLGTSFACSSNGMVKQDGKIRPGNGVVLFQIAAFEPGDQDAQFDFFGNYKILMAPHFPSGASASYRAGLELTVQKTPQDIYAIGRYLFDETVDPAETYILTFPAPRKGFIGRLLAEAKLHGHQDPGPNVRFDVYKTTELQTSDMGNMRVTSRVPVTYFSRRAVIDSLFETKANTITYAGLVRLKESEKGSFECSVTAPLSDDEVRTIVKKRSPSIAMEQWAVERVPLVCGSSDFSRK